MLLLHKIYRSRIFQYCALVVLAVLTALSFEIFVYPNDFAPSGINGVSTMVQYLFHFNVGYMALLINIPMLVVAAFILNRAYAFRTLTFVIIFSLATLFFAEIKLSETAFVFNANGDVGARLLGAIAGGFFNGLFFSLSVRMGGSTGGTDIVGEFIHHKMPEYDTVGIIFVINAVVAVSSFFVYGMRYEPVILCIVFSFVTTRVSDGIMKGARSAARFEVVTTHPEELSRELMERLRHGVTMMPARGMYTGADCAVLICIVNRRQVVEFEEIIRKYDHTFASLSTANGVIGYFRNAKHRNLDEVHRYQTK